jgi:hypothetical protein
MRLRAAAGAVVDAHTHHSPVYRRWGTLHLVEERKVPSPRSVILTLQVPYGPLPAETRELLVAELQHVDIGQVRIDDAIVSNLGIGGGPTINADLIVRIAEGVVSGVITGAILAAPKIVFKIVKGTFEFAQFALNVKSTEAETVTYLLPPDTDEEAAFDAMPADYEVTVRSETRTRVWKDGSWEVFNSHTSRGGPPPSASR